MHAPTVIARVVSPCSGENEDTRDARLRSRWDDLLSLAMRDFLLTKRQKEGDHEEAEALETEIRELEARLGFTQEQSS